MHNGKCLRRGFRRQLFVRALKISGLRFGKRSAGAAARLDAFQLSFVNGTRRSVSYTHLVAAALQAAETGRKNFSAEKTSIQSRK